MAIIKYNLHIDSLTFMKALICFFSASYLRYADGRFGLEIAGLLVQGTSDLIFSILEHKKSRINSSNVFTMSVNVGMVNRQKCHCSRYNTLFGVTTLFASELREFNFTRGANLLTAASIAGSVGNTANHFINHR